MTKCRFLFSISSLLLIGMLGSMGALASVNTVNSKLDDGLNNPLIPNDTLTYKFLSKGELKLYVFYPQGIKPVVAQGATALKRTAIVHFFGGGWTGGSPKQFYSQCAFYAAHGIVAISVDYRVQSRQHTTPFECVKDGKSAIRWVRSHAALLGVDPDMIIASGGSAGGHVAACTALIKGHDDISDDLSVSCVPAALVLFNPVLDTTPKGYGSGKVKGRETEISPNHHITEGLPPTILFHGTSDHTVPFANATFFANTMREKGNVCTFFPIKGADHGFFNSHAFKESSDNTNFDFTMKESLKFLKELNLVK